MTGIETSSCSSPTQSLVDAQTVTTPVAEKQKPVRNVDENTAPLTKDEEKVFTKIARVKLQQSGDNTVRCKTGGQSITLTKTVKARVTSLQVSVRTLHERNKKVHKYRANVSGGSADDPLIQQTSEIKKVPKEHKQKLLNKAGCATPVFVSPRKSVALKTNLGLSKNKHRQQTRVYRSLGIDFANEAREAEQQKKALLGKVIVEKT